MLEGSQPAASSTSSASSHHMLQRSLAASRSFSGRRPARVRRHGASCRTGVGADAAANSHSHTPNGRQATHDVSSTFDFAAASGVPAAERAAEGAHSAAAAAADAAPPAESQPPANGKVTVAAIDIGTNSFHLVVVRTSTGDQRRLEVIDQMKEGVRLLSGGGRFNLITSDGVEEGIRVLKRFQQVAATRKASLRAVATSAVREARNGNTFVRQVKERLGMDVEVISGFEEARLIYLGVLQALPIYDKLSLTVDIGGGSTEIVLGLDGQERSFPGLLADGDFSAEQVEDCRRFVRSALAEAGVVAEIAEKSPAGRTFEVTAGCSGTIEGVAALALGTSVGDAANCGSAARDEGASLRDMHFSAEQMQHAVRVLLKARTREARLKLPGMQARRVDVLVPGAVLLHEVFTALNITEMRVSPFALREGVLQDSLMRRGYAPTPDIRRASILHLASRFDIEQRMASALHLAQLAQQLLQGLQAGAAASPAATALSANDAFLLEAGVTLHSVGLFVSHAGHHKHAAYIIRNSEHLLGFAPAEVELIALLVRFHRKKPPSAKHEEVAKLVEPGLFDKLRALVAISRAAIALDRRNTGAAVSRVTVLQDAANIVLVVCPADAENGGVADISLELWALRQELPFFEKVFGQSCAVVEGCGDMRDPEGLLSSLDAVVSK